MYKETMIIGTHMYIYEEKVQQIVWCIHNNTRDEVKHRQCELGLLASTTLEEHFRQCLEQACQQLQVFCGYYSGLPMGRSRLFRFRLGAFCVVPVEAKAVLQ